MSELKLTNNPCKFCNGEIDEGKPPYMADRILSEEVFEAIEAYQKEDLVHAQQELAQCGAVILRTMEMLENEIENAEGAK